VASSGDPESDGLDHLGLTCTVEQAAQALGISRVAAYRSAARFRATDGIEGLPVLLLGGRRLLVPIPALRSWLATGQPVRTNGNGASS
jgi:leucine-zipper of insertion element IS481